MFSNLLNIIKKYFWFFTENKKIVVVNDDLIEPLIINVHYHV